MLGTPARNQMKGNSGFGITYCHAASHLASWDALIVQAASRANTTILYSEDLNHGRRYGDLRVENPFA